MQKKIFISVIALGLLVILFMRSKDEVKVEGSTITIDSGNTHMEGALGAEKTYEVLLKNEGIAVNTYCGDAFVMVLPFTTANQLRAAYGDFFRCDAPSAVQAIRNMRAIILVTDRDFVKEAISDAMSLVRNSRIPVVRFSGSQIQLKKHTSMNMKVNDHSGNVLYYVSDFSVLKPDFMK
jgi:hypothetical protein